MAIQLPIKTAANQWEWFAERQLEFDFELPILGATGSKPYMPSVTPADLVLDRIHSMAQDTVNETHDSADIPLCVMDEIVKLCVEYFYGQDGY
jgi:hypothetical protein